MKSGLDSMPLFFLDDLLKNDVSPVKSAVNHNIIPIPFRVSDGFT